MTVVRPTSLAARSSPRPAAKQRSRVFAFILGRGAYGATLEEMEQALDLPGNTVRPRRQELEKKGLVTDSGKTRKTEHGREAIIWVIPEPIASAAKARLGLS